MDAVDGVVDVVSDFGDGSGLAGTAIVIGDGYLVTAAHLVRDPARTGQDGAVGRVWVSDPGGYWTYPAGVVGVDDGLGLAVLWVSGAALEPATLGDAGTVGEGDELHVVGNAHGWGPLRGVTGAVLDTEAVIASTDPAIGAGSSGATSGSLSGMIEIQASVVAGDSGGAVLNGQGQVVAMILAYVPTAGSGAVPDRGYAMPINRVMHAANQRTSARRGPSLRPRPAGALRPSQRSPGFDRNGFGAPARGRWGSRWRGRYSECTSEATVVSTSGQAVSGGCPWFSIQSCGGSGAF
jgi:S1-C subfamily serine protease